MYASMIIASVAALASTTLAAPRFITRQAPLEATFNIANDPSGENVDFNITVNAPGAVTIAQALNVFNIPIWATSLDYVNPGLRGNSVRCTFNVGLPQEFVFDAQNTHLNVPEFFGADTDVSQVLMECE